MKILHVIGRLSRHDGGPPKAIRGMARALAARGHEVWIYSTDMVRADETPPPLDVNVAEGAARIRYFPVTAPRRWIRSPALGRALADIIPDCDLVVIHALYLYHSWRVPGLCRRAGVPYVIRPLGSLDPYIWQRSRWRKWLIERWHQNRDLRDAAALHFTTERERELAAPYSQGAPGFVVPLGIWPEPPPTRSRRDGAGPHLVFLGRLHPKKGIELLIDALARVAPAHPGLRLSVAGSGDPDYVAALRARCVGAGIGDRVTFTGFVEGEAKRRVLADTDLFVLPSYSENFGIAVIEAMAAGLPVLISADVNLCDSVREAGAGWACRTTLDDLAETLATALGARADWPSIGAQGREHILAHHAWPNIAEQLEQAYRTVIKRAHDTD